MKVAILGLGTVGSGVLKVIQDNQEHIQRQIGEPIEVTHIFGKVLANVHNCDLTGIEQVEEIDSLVNEDLDLVIEVLGGIDFTYDVHKKFLEKGIHVVSANKDMLAIHIDELADLANQNKVQIGYEATSAGGVPIINGMLHGLQANKISRVLGILNGTTNYILTKMTQDNWAFDLALEEATEKGYAEADPTNDVDGFDAQRKITLLSRLAYQKNINIEEVSVKGIRDVKVDDIQIALENGYVMKLLGLSEYDGKYLEISVEPTFLPVTHQLAAVDDAMNGVFVNGDAVGETMFYGPGAGSLETASAIVSDVMNIAQIGYTGNLVPTEQAKITNDFGKHPYYVRFNGEIEAAKTELETLGFSYIVLSENEALTIETEPLLNEERDRLLEDTDVAATYRMIGKDKLDG